jgi:TetR/AcrR family transcriptional regulator, regulator of mycofactocin system
MSSSEPEQAPRRGRPPTTGPRELELIALRLFGEQGFEVTTIEDIAAEAGIQRRTFHRYFSTKADVLWQGFDEEVARLRLALDEADRTIPLMDSIREAVVAINHYTSDDIPELRVRMELLSSVPVLQASAASHYDAWEVAVADYVSVRTGAAPDSLYPLAIGRTMLAACRTAYDLWIGQDESDLTEYLENAIRALASGFAETNARIETGVRADE